MDHGKGDRGHRESGMSGTPRGLAVAAVCVVVAGWSAGCERRSLEEGGRGGAVGDLAGAGNGPGSGSAGAAGSIGGAVCASRCPECPPRGGAVVSCGPAPIDAPRVSGFALAATDSDLAIAVVELDDQGADWLSLLRLSPRLDLRGTVRLDDTRQPGPLFGGGILGTAVASLPSGWVVAACGQPEIFIQALDATGKQMGRTVVSPATDSHLWCHNATPVLAARPGGGPLMAWQTRDGVKVALIAADGRSASAPQTITDLAAFSDAPAAAWIGDAFYVVAAIPASATGNTRALRIVRITPDGVATLVGDRFAGEAHGSPGIAVGAADLRVGFVGLPPGGVDPDDRSVFWQQLGPSGEALFPVVALGGHSDYYGRPAAVAFDGDTVVLMGGYTGHLGLTRVASDGQIVTPVWSVVSAPPPVGVGNYDLVRIGAEVVAGWIPPYGAGGLRLARLTP